MTIFSALAAATLFGMELTGALSVSNYLYDYDSDWQRWVSPELFDKVRFERKRISISPVVLNFSWIVTLFANIPNIWYLVLKKIGSRNTL